MSDRSTWAHSSALEKECLIWYTVNAPTPAFSHSEPAVPDHVPIRRRAWLRRTLRGLSLEGRRTCRSRTPRREHPGRGSATVQAAHPPRHRRAAVRDQLCQEPALSGTSSVGDQLCRGPALSGTSSVRDQLCRGPALSGTSSVGDQLCRGPALSGTSSVGDQLCRGPALGVSPGSKNGYYVNRGALIRTIVRPQSEPRQRPPPPE